MGTWNVGPFENDAALDWLMDPDAELSFGKVANALAIGGIEILEIDDAAQALAAAEIVAAAGGLPHPDLPEPGEAWAELNARIVKANLVAMARDAVVRVGARNSQLAEHWAMAADGAAWRAGLDDLVGRLGQLG
jgi:hypothetical protein